MKYTGNILYSCVLGVLVLFASTNAEGSGFTMTYFAKEGHPQMVNSGIAAKSAPNAFQVADLYARLSGLSPLMLEGKLLLLTALRIFPF